MARIAGALEEAEREDFVRMKTAQKLLRRKEAERKQ
jgi:vacuolar-type H+-ATPase subunit D/Vma8